MPRYKSPEAIRAEEIFAGSAAAPGELERLAKALKNKQSFGHARRLLERRFHEPAVQGSPPERLRVGQQLALCTYKDPDLPRHEALNTALALLKEVGDLENTHDQETLGLAGAVYKRLWETTARKEQLERSFEFYFRGYREGPARDQGFTAINAAYVLDLLAAQEAPEPSDRAANSPAAAAAAERVALASQIREAIISAVTVPATDTVDDYWPLVTVAEAAFGLGRFRQAEPLLKRAGAIADMPDWQKETTARQFAKLLRVRISLPTAGQDEIADARAALAHLAGGDQQALINAYRGRVGLALSGGGFRASLYHIGVLAKLAELDLLRGIECLSCVSGGSIIGAYYYLHVRRLLMTKADRDITADDYIKIVATVADEFLDGVQRNIRTRVAAEWTTNLKMIFWPDYSRTLRVGELYERELFARVPALEGEKADERWFNELTVHPIDEPEDFAPKTHNWKRAAKVPNLVLNATALNTGHNWQFTATWMGEPPAGIDGDIDANYCLRRMYYDEAPPPHDKVRLGYAVAASSCVPGLFEPLPLGKLYDARTVQLVDGGVHDNQGTGALLEQDCSVLLVSDASGQMDTVDNPSTGLLSVPLRCNSILQSRVREAQFRELATRRSAGLVSGLMFLHLKKDLKARTIDWINCQDPSDQPIVKPLAPYGIQREVQRQVAAIRTDLDSFSDTEAYALMTSGYCMTAEMLERPALLGFPLEKPRETKWTFLKIAPALAAANPDPSVIRRLRMAQYIAFKVWRFSRMLQLGAFFVAAVVLWLLYAQWNQWSELALPRLTAGRLLVALLVIVIGAVIAPVVLRFVRFPKTFQQLAIGIGMATFGFIVARLHLHVFDKLFLKDGEVR